MMTARTKIVLQEKSNGNWIDIEYWDVDETNKAYKAYKEYIYADDYVAAETPLRLISRQTYEILLIGWEEEIDE